MSFFVLFIKGYVVLEIVFKVFELYEEVVDLGDDNKFKIDECGNMFIKK